MVSGMPAEELTVTQAAAESGYSTRTIEMKVASGELASVKRGGRRIVHRADLDAWLAHRHEVA